LTICAASAIISAGCLAFLTVQTFDALVPQTAVAKHLLLAADNIQDVTIQLLKILAAGTMIPFLCIVAGYPNLNRNQRTLVGLMVGSLVVVCAYLLAAGHLISARYASYLCGTIAGVAAAVQSFRCLGQGLVSRSLLAIGIAWNVVLLVLLFPATRVSEEESIRSFVHSTQELLPPDSRIAIQDIGVFGLYSNRYIIDLVGLTDNAVLAWSRENGRIRDRISLDNVLIARGASHYINIYDGANPLQREGYRTLLTPLFDMSVERTVTNRGTQANHHWRLYRVEVKQ
jgi:hypothetical protein